MPTTPNFLRLQTVLENTISYLEGRPDSKLAAHYLDAFHKAAAGFAQSKVETDKSYLTWRHAYNDVLKASKRTFQVYGQARKGCIEWAIRGFPDFSLSYTDEEATRAAATEMLDFLEGLSEDFNWIESTTRDLKAAVDDGEQALATQEDRLRDYRDTVKLRKIGYNAGYSLSGEFFHRVKGELEPEDETLRAVTPFPIC